MVNTRRLRAQHRKSDQHHDQSSSHLECWSADSKEAQQIAAQPGGEEQSDEHGDRAAPSNRPVLTLVAIGE